MLSLIAAMTANKQVIGIEGRLPWSLPDDLQHFKQVTMGKKILMGRNTFESIGRPLPGRDNIILSRQADYQAPGCQVFSEIPAVLQSIDANHELVVIGGAKVYQQLLPYVQTMYLTLIDAEISGDCFFPVWDSTKWQETSRKTHAPDANHAYRFEFVTLSRTKT